MAYLLPLVLLFGFLSAGARHGSDVIVVPLVLLVFCFCGLVPFVRGERAGGIAIGSVRGQSVRTISLLYFAGLLAFVIPVRSHIVLFSDSFGVQIFGVPLVLPVMFVALVCAATIIVSRRITHPFLTVLASATLVTICAFVIEPAAFGFGLTAYFGNGIYYGVPISMFVVWFLSAIVGAFLCRLTLGKTLSTPSLSTVWGALLLVAYFTGIATCLNMWAPAVLGLILLQFGFRAVHYL